MAFPNLKQEAASTQGKIRLFGEDNIDLTGIYLFN
jgi:hypothetical protein